MPYRPKEPEKYRDSDWLREEYVEKKKSMTDISALCDCSKETIRRWLNRHDIPIRSQSEATKAEWEGAEERKEEVRKRMEKHIPEHIQTGEHREETIRKMSEVKLGEGNPMWQGVGERTYYGPSWPSWRRKVLKRDDYTCQECGHEDDSNHVHHKEPVRSFDEPDDAHFDENLITLCVTCHSKVEPRRISE